MEIIGWIGAAWFIGTIIDGVLDRGVSVTRNTMKEAAVAVVFMAAAGCVGFFVSWVLS